MSVKEFLRAMFNDADSLSRRGDRNGRGAGLLFLDCVCL
jgi:hypothetical protein